jgi:hypothetical protein
MRTMGVVYLAKYLLFEREYLIGCLNAIVSEFSAVWNEAIDNVK